MIMLLAHSLPTLHSHPEELLAAAVLFGLTALGFLRYRRTRG